jgi:hypothetical protein
LVVIAGSALTGIAGKVASVLAEAIWLFLCRAEVVVGV